MSDTERRLAELERDVYNLDERTHKYAAITRTLEGQMAGLYELKEQVVQLRISLEGLRAKLLPIAALVASIQTALVVAFVKMLVK